MCEKAEEKLMNRKNFLLIPLAKVVSKIKGVSSWLRIQSESVCLQSSTILARSGLTQSNQSHTGVSSFYRSLFFPGIFNWTTKCTHQKLGLNNNKKCSFSSLETLKVNYNPVYYILNSEIYQVDRITISSFSLVVQM